MSIETVSRQRKWQLIQKAKGSCIRCGKPAKLRGTYREFCEECGIKQKGYRHRRYLNRLKKLKSNL